MLSPEERAKDICYRAGWTIQPWVYDIIVSALAECERAAYERAADKIEEIGKSQGNARDDALLLGISFVIRALAEPPP